MGIEPTTIRLRSARSENHTTRPNSQPGHRLDAVCVYLERNIHCAMERALAWHSNQVPGIIVVSISACHAEDPGSIPGRGVGLELITSGSVAYRGTSLAVSASGGASGTSALLHAPEAVLAIVSGIAALARRAARQFQGSQPSEAAFCDSSRDRSPSSPCRCLRMLWGRTGKLRDVKGSARPPTLDAVKMRLPPAPSPLPPEGGLG